MPIPKLLITAGLMAANMALTMTRKIEGPRLDDLKFTGGDYGASLANVWGMRRIQPPIFWAEDLREVKRKRKTKGGKYNEYTYYGTWAVALAGHPIDSVRRIWFDTHLVLDLSGAGPVTPFALGDLYTNLGSRGVSGVGEKFANSNIAVYLGTEDQEPDPRMQATVEAEFGEGSCPAYRGTAYIVFKDIPLEKIGNRIPQVSVEFIGNAGESYPFETRTASYDLAFAGDFATYANPGSSTYSIYDTATGQEIISGALSPTRYGGGQTCFDKDGSFIDRTNSISYPVRWDVNGVGTTELEEFVVQTWGWNDANGDFHWGAHGYTPYYTLYFDGVAFDLPGTYGHTGFHPAGFFADLDGGSWAICESNSDAEAVLFFKLTARGVGDGSFQVATPGNSGSLNGAVHYRDADVNHFVFTRGGTIYAADPTTEALTLSNTTTFGAPHFRDHVLGISSMWFGFYEFALSDLSLIRTLDPTDWTSGTAATAEVVYDPINHALLQVGANKMFYLDRVASNGVTLGEILDDLSDWCGVEDYDFSALDQVIPGWSATRGAAQDMSEPLLDVYDCDIRPHDFGIQGVKRSGVTSGTLATEDFVGEPRYTVKVRQAAELPAVLMADFADVNADQQPNSARASRPLDATGARGEKKLDLTTLALDADTGVQLLNRVFRRMWNERREINNALTAQELGLEPGDVKTLALDSDTITARCINVTVSADDTLKAEWKYDAPSLATLDGSTGASFDGRNEDGVVVPMLSKGFVLDIPYIEDSDAQTTPILYGLASPYAEGTWPGAIIYEAIDGEYSDELLPVASSSQATWGRLSGTMADANPNLWDRGTEITVTLQVGELTGCTEAAANADPTLNLAAIGRNGRWELVQFTNATLTSGTTYTVSGFKRGRRGTEWACGIHETGDEFVLLATAAIASKGLSDVGTDLSFKPVTSGRTEAGAFAIDLSYTGASLKPYAPANVEAVKEGSGDWTFTWTRRTRVGGAWTSGTTIPLGETSENYTVVILDGETEVREIDVTSETATYASADQTTDFGAEVTEGNLEFAVYQISDEVGRGFAAEATA